MSSISLPMAEETGRRLAAVYAPIAPELAEADRI